MNDAIECSNLTKKYGRLAAVDSLSFKVPDGSLTGFVGPNGAGKTSTIKILAGLSRQDSGAAMVKGVRAEPGYTRKMRMLGYLPDDPVFAGWMSPMEHLFFAGRLHSLSAGETERRAAELLETFGLARLVERKTSGFSKGERQRLGLAHALIGGPAVLIMDEPTSGLDPLGRRELLEYIAGLKGRVTVLFSTHLLVDVDRVCDRVVMLDRGKSLAAGGIDTLKKRYGKGSVKIELRSGAGALAERLRGVAWCERISREEESLEIEVSSEEAAGLELPKMVSDMGLAMKGYSTGEPSLEEVYARILDEAGGGRLEAE